MVKSNKRVFLLDLGGIFFAPAWRQVGITRTSDELGVPRITFKALLEKYKLAFYTGKLSEDDYWTKVITEANVPQYSVAKLKQAYRSYVLPIKQVFNFLPQLSKSYTLVACNNSPKEWMDYRRYQFTLDQYFSKYYTSGYLGYMKSAPQFFGYILSKHDKKELLYLDDNLKYVDLARKTYGIQSHLYQNIKTLCQLIR